MRPCQQVWEELNKKSGFSLKFQTFKKFHTQIRNKLFPNMKKTENPEILQDLPQSINLEY